MHRPCATGDDMQHVFMALAALPWPALAIWVLLGNSVVFGTTLGVGELLVHAFGRKPTTPAPPPLTRKEVLLAAACVVVNSGVTFLGIVLWQRGIIHVGMAVTGWTILDVIALFLLMDVSMYALHRLAHTPLLFSWVHATHHQFENPRPLTLFVMNPLETALFGLLWIVVITVYSASWLGIVLYLIGNLAFGLIGHLGVEPFGRRWLNLPGVRQVSTSTFHTEHHQTAGYNFGFYTLVWDRLFGTLSPTYERDFLQANQEAKATTLQPGTSTHT
jgi:Delta7-sterol 5-desaturase